MELCRGTVSKALLGYVSVKTAKRGLVNAFGICWIVKIGSKSMVGMSGNMQIL